MLSLENLLYFAALKQMPIEKRRGIVREYLQTLALSFLQQSSLAPRMIFIGGTALRFFYDLRRFSEDLDFNYRGTLKEQELYDLGEYLKKAFAGEGIALEFSVRKSQESYFHWKVYLKFPDILQVYGCAGRGGQTLHPGEMLSIQIDFHNLGKAAYPLQKKIIAHFGKRFLMNTTNLEMFLAEKSHAMLFRKSARGRDFFDFMSLIGWGARLDLSSLKQRAVDVKSSHEYRRLLERKVSHLNFKKLTDQLSPFLFSAEDVTIMRSFPDHLGDLLNVQLKDTT